MSKVKFGLVLPNRGPLVGLFTPQELIGFAEAADSRFPAIDSVWGETAFWLKPRFECNTLLAAVAARTKHVTLGPACFASFPLRQPLRTSPASTTFRFQSGCFASGRGSGQPTTACPGESGLRAQLRRQCSVGPARPSHL